MTGRTMANEARAKRLVLDDCVVSGNGYEGLVRNITTALSEAEGRGRLAGIEEAVKVAETHRYSRLVIEWDGELEEYVEVRVTYNGCKEIADALTALKTKG